MSKGWGDFSRFIGLDRIEENEMSLTTYSGSGTSFSIIKQLQHISAITHRRISMISKVKLSDRQQMSACDNATQHC